MNRQDAKGAKKSLVLPFPPVAFLKVKGTGLTYPLFSANLLL